MSGSIHKTVWMFAIEYNGLSSYILIYIQLVFYIVHIRDTDIIQNDRDAFIG